MYAFAVWTDRKDGRGKFYSFPYILAIGAGMIVVIAIAENFLTGYANLFGTVGTLLAGLLLLIRHTSRADELEKEQDHAEHELAARPPKSRLH